MKNNIGRLTSARQNKVNQLELVKQSEFAGSEVDLYKGVDGEVYMTAKQLGEALEYSSGAQAITNIINRNEYLDNEEFSVQLKLSSTDGKSYDTRLLTEDGIYEITMLSKQPKAREFRMFIRELLKGLRKGDLQVQKPMSTKDLLLQASLEHELRIEQVESKVGNLTAGVETIEESVNYLINEVPIRNHQQIAIEMARKKVVIDALGGMKSNAYKELSRKVFSEIGRDFKNHFNVPRYNELPQSRYEEGLMYISKWRPSTNTQVLIDEANGQLSLWGGSTV